MTYDIWIDATTHYKASGDVDSSGQMTGATVDDNNGTTVTRDHTFESKSDFQTWARNFSNRGW